MTEPEPPDYATSPFGSQVHNPRPRRPLPAMDEDTVRGLREKLISSILQIVVQALTGAFIPGGGLGGIIGQLQSWTSGIPIIGDFVQAITGSLGNLTDLSNFFNFANPVNLLSGLINGVVGGSGNPLSNLISSLLGTASTASTANTNATSALGNWTSLLAGIPGVSTIAGFLGFLQPTGSDRGIFGTLINGVVGGTTNPLSSLISSFLGTASTASTANTNATTSLSNWTSLLAGIPGVSTVVQAGNVISNVLTSIGSPSGMSGTPGSFNPVSAGVQIIDALIPDLGFLRGGLFRGFTGQTASSVTEGAVSEATSATSEAVAGLGASFTALAAALSTTGTPDADDFERTTIGSGWVGVVNGGALSIPDGHNLHYSGTGSSAEYVMRRVTANAVDRMTSTAVLNEAIPTYFFLPLPYGGNIDIWVRCTAFTTFATRSGVRLRINSTGLGASWTLANVVNGTVTHTLKTGSCAIPAKGGFPSLEAGAGGTPRRFVGTLNGSPIEGCDYTDTGLVTGFGPTYRWRGFGGKGNSGVGTNQGTPDIKQWGGG